MTRYFVFEIDYEENRYNLLDECADHVEAGEMPFAQILHVVPDDGPLRQYALYTKKENPTKDWRYKTVLIEWVNENNRADRLTVSFDETYDYFVEPPKNTRTIPDTDKGLMLVSDEQYVEWKQQQEWYKGVYK